VPSWSIPSVDQFSPAEQAVLARLAECEIIRGASPIRYHTLLALAIAMAPASVYDLWDMIILRTGHYPQEYELLDAIVAGVFAYYRDQVRPGLHFRAPTDHERVILMDLVQTIRHLPVQDLESITWYTYDVGKRYYGEGPGLRQFFQAVYEILLGQPDGPRLPLFIHLQGIDAFARLVDHRLEVANGC